MSDFYTRQIFIIISLYKKKKDKYIVWDTGDDDRWQQCAFQPKIFIDEWYKFTIGHAYTHLHISDCSTRRRRKKSKTPHSRPSTQSVRRSATAETVSIDHLKQNAGTICPNHSVRFGEFKP